MIKILFVCMGNICRSPTAHGVMQHKLRNRGLINRICVDSAGTHAYHVNEKSDPRACATASARGVDMGFIRARKISVNDYDEFNYILAMDQDNLDLIRYYAPPKPKADIRLFLDFANQAKQCDQTVVPDPYYGGDAGFDQVFALVETGCDALIDYLLDT